MPAALRTARALLLAVPFAASACQTPWVEDGRAEDVVETNVVIRSEPSGAMIHFNGKRQDAAPIRIPVRYPHVTEQWARSSNFGASIREGTGVVGTILLLPIWIPASFVQYRETIKRHRYGGNVHVIRATFADRTEREETVTLDGEAEVTVTLVPPR
ncbi:MAG: hypothetical protein HMLKMBBP_01709 [Planctomycetes bacterium]|nr:hypothetical protein [Planctomycetota bacterium]